MEHRLLMCEVRKNINQISTLNNIQLIDVRTEKEVENTALIDPNTIHIPLDSLRSRIDELDPNKAYVLYCAKGLRGYLASLILLHNGYKNVTNLDDGFTAWSKMN